MTEEDSPYMVFEYMEYGDLADLLRKNDPIHGREKTLDLKQVKTRSLVYAINVFDF